MTEPGKVTRLAQGAAAPADVSVPEGLSLREGETSTNDPEMAAYKRASARHCLVGALACGGAALGLGAVCLLYLLTHDFSRFLAASHPAVLPQLASYGLGTSLLLGIAAGVMAWEWKSLRAPQKPYGPEPPPKPMTRRRWALRAVGCWLLTLPFSGICLGFAYGAVNYAVRQSWKAAGIFLVVAACFGGLGVMLVAGSGVVAQAGAVLKPGAPVPAAVRKSPWWRHSLWVIFFWCLFITYAAVSSGVQGKGGDSVGYASAAFVSWSALLAARRGKMPDDPFSG